MSITLCTRSCARDSDATLFSLPHPRNPAVSSTLPIRKLESWRTEVASLWPLNSQQLSQASTLKQRTLKPSTESPRLQGDRTHGGRRVKRGTEAGRARRGVQPWRECEKLQLGAPWWSPFLGRSVAHCSLSAPNGLAASMPIHMAPGEVSQELDRFSGLYREPWEPPGLTSSVRP